MFINLIFERYQPQSVQPGEKRLVTEIKKLSLSDVSLQIK